MDSDAGNSCFRIILRRGPRGFGFTVHTIRVYFGDTDYYTMHHTVMAIDEGSPGKVDMFWIILINMLIWFFSL